MIRRFLLRLVVFAVLAGPASTTAALAQPVALTSGEHDGFTRLVADFGHPVDWRIGRTEDGYALMIEGAQPSYDLRQVFDIIGKTRLAAIWAEPETGALRIGIACACHMLPFEFRPGIVVMDLKDGPPKKGSSFELTLAGVVAGTLKTRQPPRPRSRPADLTPPYRWIGTALIEEKSTGATLPFPENPAMEDLRDTLLRQLSRGAAAGVVDLHLPEKPPQEPIVPFPSAQIRIGDAGTLEAAPADTLAADGTGCIAEDRLTIETWGQDGPAAGQFASAMAGMTGEFDRPEPEAIQKAVRFQLFLGFGLEARQTLLAFSEPLPDAPLWRSLAYILDAELDPAPFFRGQTACDGAAALWAMLSDPAPKPGDAVNSTAIRRSFSALPAHLRRHLGPALAERFLTLGDGEAARAIRDAILRAPGDPGAEVTRLEAEMSLSAGDPAEAETQIAPLVTSAGPDSAEALSTYVKARVAQLLPVTPEVVTALEAFQAESAGSQSAPVLAEALILARAASGDFAAAFAELPESPQTEASIWALLLRLGNDDAFLAEAIRPPEMLPPLRPDLSKGIAERLLGLGFGDPALLWLQRLDPSDPRRLAEAYLLLRDGRSALSALAGRSAPEDLRLKAKALSILNNPAAAAEALQAAGEEEAAWPSRSRAELWPELAADGPEPWRSLAAELAPIEAIPDEGPLARDHRLAAASSETRRAALALLTAVPKPEANP